MIQNSNPTREDVRDWFQKNRNVCRCTGYKPLVDAVMDAAKLMRGEIKKEELWYKLPKGESILGSKASTSICSCKSYRNLGFWSRFRIKTS